MTVQVRPYAAADCAACWSVFHRAVQIGARAHYTQAQRDAWSPEQPMPGAERCARLMQAMTLVAVHPADQSVIGFMSLLKSGHLDMAFVDPGHMGSGVADALHQAVIATARDNGLNQLTTDASHLARRFLDRHGWALCAPETIMRNGVSLTRFRMTLSLGDPA